MNLKSSIIVQSVDFDKVASLQMSKNVAEWKEDILEQFNENIGEILPPNAAYDVDLSSNDDNRGYAAGSVVTWVGSRKINFPVIITDYNLQPMDVFVVRIGKELKYFHATEDNIRKALTGEELMTNEIKGEPQGSSTEVKRPGGAEPAVPVMVGSMTNSSSMPAFQKVAEAIDSDPALLANYVKNSGQTIYGIMKVAADAMSENDKKLEISADSNGIVQAKKAATVVDSQIFNPKVMDVLDANQVVEVRLETYPTMEDFLESDPEAGGEIAKKVGKPLSGVVLLPQMIGTSWRASRNNYPEEVDRRFEYVFISTCGQFVKADTRYDRRDSFFGTLLSTDKSYVSKTIDIAAAASASGIKNELNKFNPAINKFFAGVKSNNLESDRYGSSVESCGSYHDSKGVTIILVLESGKSYIIDQSKVKRIAYNGKDIYETGDMVLVPANIADIQEVNGFKDDVLKKLIGRKEKTLLYPSNAKVVILSNSRRIKYDTLMTPDTDVKKKLEKLKTIEVELRIGNGGFEINGKPVSDIARITGKTSGLSYLEVKNALKVLGVKEENIKLAADTAVARARAGVDSSTSIYGVTGGIIDNEKLASYNDHIREGGDAFEQFASFLQRDLTKEASELSDPDAVDVVLSLNIVNKDNINTLIENVGEFERVQGKIAELLIMSRAGLKSVDDGALKKIMENLTEVIDSIKRLKVMAKK